MNGGMFALGNLQHAYVTERDAGWAAATLQLERSLSADASFKSGSGQLPLERIVGISLIESPPISTQRFARYTSGRVPFAPEFDLIKSEYTQSMRFSGPPA